jgi:hypothetical protein
LFSSFIFSFKFAVRYGSEIGVVVAASVANCTSECAKTSGCKSYFYDYELSECHLSNATVPTEKDQTPQDLAATTGMCHSHSEGTGEHSSESGLKETWCHGTGSWDGSVGFGGICGLAEKRKATDKDSGSSSLNSFHALVLAILLALAM